MNLYSVVGVRGARFMALAIALAADARLCCPEWLMYPIYQIWNQTVSVINLTRVTGL